MKKRISVILLALVMCFAAVGCNNTPSDETGEEYVAKESADTETADAGGNGE